MITELNFQLHKKLISAATFISVVVILIGFLVLTGWQFNVGFLKQPIPNRVAMNPLTALLFICTGITILLNIFFKTSKTKYFFRYFLIFFILFSGCIKIYCLISGYNIPIDTTMYHSKLGLDSIGTMPNKMAPNTAFNFILTGLALFFLNEKAFRNQVVSHIISVAVFFVGFLSFLGYVYSLGSLYGIMDYIPMAIHTAITFILVSVAILFVRPDKGIMRILTGRHSGSTSARLMIPIVIIAPSILGYLRLLGENNGFYSKEIGVAIMVLSIIISLLLLILYNTNALNKTDKLKTEAEEKIRTINHRLEHIIEERTKELAELNRDLEKKVLERTAQLELVNKELESFSYSVSHDLRAPLRAINGYSKMIEEDYGRLLDEEGKRLLVTVQSSAHRMAMLIDDLLAFSKIGKKEVAKNEIDIKAFVESVVNDINKSIDHHAEIIINTSGRVIGDQALLTQVLFNLISNGVKYSAKKEKPEIRITSEIKNDEVVFCISDNGAGFDMKYAPKLFGVFQRLHAISEFEGTGVGLAIVKRIIEKHNGRIWAEAKIDEGATFYFTLPLK